MLVCPSKLGLIGDCGSCAGSLMVLMVLMLLVMLTTPDDVEDGVEVSNSCLGGGKSFLCRQYNGAAGSSYLMDNASGQWSLDAWLLVTRYRSTLTRPTGGTILLNEPGLSPMELAKSTPCLFCLIETPRTMKAGLE